MRCFVIVALAIHAGAFLHAQIIDAGSSTDQGFIGGYSYTSPALALQQGVYRTLRSSNPGLSFAYDIQVPNGSCAVKLHLIEPRPAGPDATKQSAIGTRVFTVAVNGVQAPPIDIFALSGALMPLVLPLAPVMVSDGHLRLNFAPLVPFRGNPVVSAIERDCTPTAPPTSAYVPPKFQVDSFPIPPDVAISLTLSKTPVPDSGMFLFFATDFFGDGQIATARPTPSRVLNFTPPITGHSGTLDVAYWSLD